SLWRRKRWRRPEHYMAMVCGWRQLELDTSSNDAIASTARRCRYGLFAWVRPCDCLWWTKQRDAAERHLAIYTVRPCSLRASVKTNPQMQWRLIFSHT